MALVMYLIGTSRTGTSIPHHVVNKSCSSEFDFEIAALVPNASVVYDIRQLAPYWDDGFFHYHIVAYIDLVGSQ